MQEPIVTYKQAAHLKEFGFDQKTTYFYDILDENLYLSYVQKLEPDNFNQRETLLSAPTVSFALEWIRMTFRLYCGVYPNSNEPTFKLGYYWRYFTIQGEEDSMAQDSSPLSPFGTYTEAESDLLSFVLEYIEYHVKKD